MKIFKYGIEFFSGLQTRYGGHWQKLSNFTQLDYLAIAIGSTDTFYDVFILNNFDKILNLQTVYYDGHHHHINFIFFIVLWGGRPYE